MLNLFEISVKYFEEEALKKVSINLKTGEIVSLVGANGAGKTTLLKSIVGLVSVSHGRIILGEMDITCLPSHQRPSLGIGMVPEGRQIISSLTVLENLLIGAYSRHKKDGMKRIRQDLKEIFDLFPVLAGRKDQMGSTLSGGEQQMLAIGRGLMGKPKVLLLDEPSLGLAPVLVQEIFRTVAKLRNIGLSILLVEQNAKLALKICNYAYVIENGIVKMAGLGEELLSNDYLRKAYLGSGDLYKPESA